MDWSKSMKQSYEFYVVDPSTWTDILRLENVKTCTINRDLSDSTLGSASIDVTESLDECYIRIYLIAIQNGITEKIPLGTFLVQTPSISFDGKSSSYSLDAYTPLIELKNVMPPVGYTILKNETIMDLASRLCSENLRAPVVSTSTNDKIYSDFIANLDDSWLSFLSDLISNAKYMFELDELGRVLFAPQQDIGALQPVWIYNDDNASILYPGISDERDLYGIPNVVEVVYSTETDYLFSRVVNDDPDSPVSVSSRGREVVYRESNPNFSGIPSQELIDKYAKQLLRNKSCLEHTITYTHGYCPVRLGDCVLLNYKKAGFVNVKARVIRQSIKCETGCSVEETAAYTTKLWRG